MPADFDKCVSEGGRVRTKKLKDGKYIHICFKDGKSYSGEVKMPKNAGSKLSAALREMGGKRK